MTPTTREEKGYYLGEFTDQWGRTAPTHAVVDEGNRIPGEIPGKYLVASGHCSSPKFEVKTLDAQTPVSDAEAIMGRLVGYTSCFKP